MLCKYLLKIDKSLHNGESCQRWSPTESFVTTKRLCVQCPDELFNVSIKSDAWLEAFRCHLVPRKDLQSLSTAVEEVKQAGAADCCSSNRCEV